MRLEEIRMKSPFALFRKHQKVLMAVMTGLAMISFVVMDSVRMDTRGISIPILLGVAGMGLFGYFGWRRQETLTYGAVGTALGIIIGVFIMFNLSSGPKPPVETQLGNISHDELRELMDRRRIANNFIRLAYEKVDPPRADNPFMAQFWEQQVSQRMFGFFGRDREDVADDVILGFLLDKEADDLGIVVSDSTVSDYINRMTNGKLTPSAFNATLKVLNVKESQVFNAIRGELRAKLAMELLVPHANPTPEQYWADYRKLSLTETLDVAGVPVADFLAQAPEPTKEQVNEYFMTWKEVPAQYPGAAGLRQPRRVRAEYLQADFAEVEKEAMARPITDAEVKKYYEDHREEFRTRPASGSTGPIPSIIPPESPLAPSTTPKSGSTGPEFGDQLQGLGLDLSQPQKSTPPADSKSAPGKTAPPAKTPAPKNDAGKSGTSLDRPTRPIATSSALDAEMLALADTSGDTARLLAYQAGDAAHKATPSSVPAKPAASKTAPAKPAAPKTAPAISVEEPPPPALPQPSAKSAKSAGKSGAPEPEFRPLDASLEREIRDSILHARTREAMKAKIQMAYAFMSRIREQLIPAELDAPPKMSSEQRKQALTKYAADNHLKYVLTPPMSYEEFHDAAETYPIAQAAEPVDDPFQQRRPIEVLQQLFSSPVDQLFQPFQAEDNEGHRYAYWKEDDIADHVPNLDDPGVREQAIRGWKIEKYAQGKAKERADELADLARKSKQPMREALAGQTVTKKEKGPAVLVVSTPSFSWISVQTAAPQGLQQDSRPRLSEIPGVKDVDDGFMRVVFDEMHKGDVKVVPNRGQMILYVVRVDNRHPSNEAELEGFRARFMKENFFGSHFMFAGPSTYDYLNAPQQQQLTMEWAQSLYAKYKVRRNFEEEQPRSRRRAAAAM